MLWNRLFKLLQKLVKTRCHQFHTYPNIGIGNETAQAKHNFLHKNRLKVLWNMLISLPLIKMLTEMCWKLDVTLQSCDLRTTSKSMKMRFVSSWLPVRRICFTAITYRIRNIFNIFGCNFWINKKIFGIHVLRGYYSTCPDGVCLIFTTLPQVPFPKSPKSSKSSMCAGIRLPLTYK